MKKHKSVLVISDTHAPCMHQDAVPFLTAVKKKYKPDTAIHIGDEIDNHAISFHDSDPDNPSASDELSLAIKQLTPLYSLFPRMQLLHSNHGSLVLRRGRASGLSERYFKTEGEILEAPKGWTWHQEVNLTLPNGQLVHFHHGRSKNGLRYTQEMGCNTVQGHYHTVYGINYTSSPSQLTWSMQVGCLFDDSHRAFRYNKLQKGRPIIGCGIIINSLPYLLPMVLDKNGRWIKNVP